MANAALARFFDRMNQEGLKLTYDDVRLCTRYSEVLPHEADLRSRFSKKVPLKIPIVSSPMDTVTTARMAIAMAEYGGLGIIHRGLSPEAQAKQVSRVKKRRNGLIETPITVKHTMTVTEVLTMLAENDFPYQTLPVLDGEGRMVGLMTQNDFDFCIDPQKKVTEVMTPFCELMTGPPSMSRQDAYERMLARKKKVLPLVEDECLKGMYLFKDLKHILFGGGNQNLDKNGQLVVGAAVGVGRGALERAELLAPRHCDVFHIDTAHADSKNVFETIRALKRAYPHIDVTAGNVSNGDSANRLADAGADGIFVGQGPGSICTTRVVAGIGMPQVSAVYECARAVEGYDIPICADGGVTSSGDIVIALAIGASSVMLGRLLAGTAEAPGESWIHQGVRYKGYRGMGSAGAMRDNASSRERYGQEGVAPRKVVPEGVEGGVPFIGTVAEALDQYVGGLRSGMGYNGARTISDLASGAELFRISPAGLRESHPHDLAMIAPTSNYVARQS